MEILVIIQVLCIIVFSLNIVIIWYMNSIGEEIPFLTSISGWACALIWVFIK